MSKMKFEFIEGEKENGNIYFRLMCDDKFFIDLNNEEDVMSFLECYKLLNAHNKITFKETEINLYEFAEICKQIFQRIQKLYITDQKYKGG